MKFRLPRLGFPRNGEEDEEKKKQIEITHDNTSGHKCSARPTSSILDHNTQHTSDPCRCVPFPRWSPRLSAHISHTLFHARSSQTHRRSVQKKNRMRLGKPARIAESELGNNIHGYSPRPSLTSVTRSERSNVIRRTGKTHFDTYQSRKADSLR